MFSNSQGILITGGRFTHHSHSSKDRGIDLLLQASAPAAFHDSGHQFDPPKCHPNTRVAILTRIMDWVIGQGDLDRFILWLYGPAGSGKSAIGRTLAERAYAQKCLLAGFFFSRSDGTRNNLNSFVASLVYQLAINFPFSRALIEAAIQNDPAIFTRSVKTQFTTLIIDILLTISQSGAFKKNTSPCLFIIDGLDECDPNTRCSVLDVISNSFSHHQLPLKFLIASRPEPDISVAFSSSALDNITNRLALDDSYYPDADIERFLTDSFLETRASHPLKNFTPTIWPTRNDIRILVRKSSGQFIYAATVVKYVSSIRRRPTDQLEVVLGLRPPQNDSPFAELDALYSDILSKVEDIDIVLRILGILVLPKNPNGIKLTPDPTQVPHLLEELLCLNRGDVHCRLIDLSSILDCGGENLEIRLLHASFGDYLFDPSRSREYHIEPGAIHAELACICLKWITIKCKSTSAISVNMACSLYIEHDTGTDKMLLPYIAGRNLIFHCSNANTTEELRGWILNTDVVTYISDSGDSRRVYLIPDFISFLKSARFSEPDELYLHHLQLLDQVLHEKLNNIHSEQLITIHTNPDVLSTQPAGNFSKMMTEMTSNFVDSASTWRDRLNPFPFFYPHDPYPFPYAAYQDMLFGFFAQPDQAGRFFLDGVKYAEAAAIVLKHISAPSAIEAHDLHLLLEILERLFFRSSYSEKLLAAATSNIYLRTYTSVQSRDAQLLPSQVENVEKAIKNYLDHVCGGPTPQIHITLLYFPSR